MTSAGFIHGARQEATTARSESRSDIISYGRPATLRIGRVTALQGGGACQVTLLDDIGGDSSVIDFVHTVPAATQTLDAIVWVVFWEGNPLPVIIGGTGGGDGDGLAGYFQSERDLGHGGALR